MTMTKLEHANFRNIVLITDRGYEAMNNLEICIAKKQKLITSVKCSQVAICNAFSFGISGGCRPTYFSRKPNKGKHSHPAMPQTETPT